MHVNPYESPREASGSSGDGVSREVNFVLYMTIGFAVVVGAYCLAFAIALFF
jgi:hypothetical protein